MRVRRLRGIARGALRESILPATQHTYVPVLTFQPYLQTVIGNVQRSPLDSYVPALTLTLVVVQAGEVDDIEIMERPYGLIDLEET